MREERETQIRPGLSHPPSSKGELFCERPGIGEAAEKAAARSAHQNPKVKRKTRQMVANFFDPSFTELIVTL